MHGHDLAGPSRSAPRRAAMLALAMLAIVCSWAISASAASARPLVTITSPSEGYVGNDSSPTFSGVAEPGFVVTVAIHEGPTLSGAVVEEPSVLVFQPGGAWSVEATGSLRDGTYTAQASESNGTGETGTSQAVTFTVDTAAPTVVLVAPESPSSNTTPSFTGTATEPSKLVTVQIHAGSSVTGTLVSIASAIGTGATWRSDPASPSLPVGQYTAIATQESSIPGNPTGRSEPVAFAVVAPPPTGPTDLAPQPPSPPAAAFRWIPAAPKTGEEVLLVSSSSDASAAIDGFAWSLSPEGAFSAGGSVLGTSFAAPGPHMVRLQVTAADGLAAVASETIEVSGRPASIMAPFPVVRLAGTETRAGVRLALLKVQQAPAGAQVTVRCRGRGCPVRSARRVTVRGAHGVAPLVFGAFERFLAAGTVLEILITKEGEIGKFTRFTVRAGRLPERFDECLDPTGRRPLACPS